MQGIATSSARRKGEHAPWWTAAALGIVAVAVLLWPRAMTPPTTPAERPRTQVPAPTPMVEPAVTRAIVPPSSPVVLDESATPPPLEPGRLRVIAANLDLPVAGMPVHVVAKDRENADETTVETGSDGSAVLELPPGCYAARASSLEGAGAVGTVVAGRTTTVIVPCGIRVRVMGTVTEPDGTPVAGADVFAFELGRTVMPTPIGDRPIARSDERGRFELDDVPPTTMLGARADGYAASPLASGAWSSDADDEVGVLLVVSPAEATASGRVVAATGEGCAGARVRLVPRDGTHRVDDARGVLSDAHPVEARAVADGTFEVRHGRAGAMMVEISAPGMAAQQRRATLAVGANDLGTIAMEPESRLRVNVVDDGGAPVVGANVTIFWRSEVVHTRRFEVTDENGCASCGGLPAAEINVWVSGRGLVAQAAYVATQPGQTSTVEIVVPQPSTIAGTLVDASGTALAGYRIRAAHTNERFSRSGCTDEHGSFEMPVRDGQHYRLQVSGARPRIWSDVPGFDDVAAGARGLVVPLPDPAAPAGSVQGRCIDTHGAPVRVALRLYATQPKCSDWLPPSDRRGVFEIAALPAGGYRLRASPVAAELAPRDVTFDLTAGQRLDLGDVVFDPPGHIEVLVDTGGAEPPTRTWLSLRSQVDGQREITTPLTEARAVVPVDPGDYVVEACGAWVSPPKRVTVGSGESVRVVLDLRRLRR